MKQNYGARNHGAEGVDDQTHISVVTDEVLTIGLKSWAGAENGLLLRCSGGVSAVMGSSISMHTLSSVTEHPAISCRAHCLLGRRPIVGMACHAQSPVCSDEAGRSPMGHASVPGVEDMTLQERVNTDLEGD